MVEFHPDMPLTPVALIGAKVCLLLGLLGIFTNIFVFWALSKSKKWFSASNVLFLNLFLCDTVFSGWEVAANLFHVFTGTRWFGYATCQVGGYVSATLVGASFVSVLLQTLNPFFVIVMDWSSLTGGQMVKLLVVVWLTIGGGFSNLPYIGGDMYVPQSSFIWCHLDYTSDSPWVRANIFLTMGMLISAPFLMIAAYSMMWIKMRRQVSQNKTNRTQWQVVRTGAYFIVTSIVFWAVPLRTMILQYLYPFNQDEFNDVLLVLLASLPNVCNSLLFVAVNSDVRQNIFRIFDPDYRALSNQESQSDLLQSGSNSHVSKSERSLKFKSLI